MTLFAPAVLVSLKLWYAGGGATVEEVWGGFPRVLFSFFLGVLIFRLWARGYHAPFRLSGVVILVILVFLYSWRPMREALYGAVLVVVAQPLLVWLAASGTASAVPLRAMRWLGDVSYAVYVLHIPIFIGIGVMVGDIRVLDGSLGTSMSLEVLQGYPVSAFPLVLLALPLTVLAAHVATYAFDRPARRWLAQRAFAAGRDFDENVGRRPTYVQDGGTQHQVSLCERGQPSGSPRAEKIIKMECSPYRLVRPI